LGTFARLVRMEHALFSLPMFISGALVAGEGNLPSWSDWILIAVAGTAARSLALALNRYIDRHIDAANPRTAVRELPAGHLSPAQVIGFIVLSLLAYAGAAWLIAPICFYLSWIPLVVFGAYPFMKRFTALCHFGVGAGLGLAPLGGYLAAAKSWPISEAAWLLGLFTMLWVAGFDIIYAQLDLEVDRREGLHSLPKLLGRWALALSAMLHAAAVVVLIVLWAGPFGGKAWLWLPTGLMALLFVLQHRHAEKVELAAFRINMLVGFVMLGFVAVGVFG
jgi:4-hydroxybenzoate polyprenyltransferase